MFEEIVQQLTTAVELDAIFAFASRAGVQNLLQDPACNAFLKRGGKARVLVGLDAITDRPTLETLTDIEAQFPSFRAFVFKNASAKLFHPKVVRTTEGKGSGCIVVGSGNLTPGGLRENIEAYSVLRFKKAEAPDLTPWDTFYTAHAIEITPIDPAALERGDRNRFRSNTTRATARAAAAPAPEKVVAAAAVTEGEEDAQAALADILPDTHSPARMLVAEVPKAGGRWNQIHFNVDVSEGFFRAEPDSNQRVFLRRLQGIDVVLEPPRPVVLSHTNLNRKIEFAAHHGEPYPAAGRPILVIRELGLRQFVYLMLLPGEAGHTEMSALLAANPSVGKGLRRFITDRATVQTAWPELPI